MHMRYLHMASERNTNQMRLDVTVQINMNLGITRLRRPEQNAPDQTMSDHIMGNHTGH